MATESLRRYLQPASTLRWHPWAPLAAMFLALLFAFYFGAQWGFAASERFHRIDVFAVPVERQMADLMAQRWPARAMVFEASAFDQAVMYVARRPPPTRWDSLRDSVEATVFPDRRRRIMPTRENVAGLAEHRLREWSAANPRWQVTATYCDEMHSVARHLLPHYQQLAAAYTDVLGRPVSAEELAPAVPSWECPAK